jgi:DNA primase
MASPVEKIKERISIVDLISSYIQVVQAGKNYKAKCPFHNEKTPSFFISPDRGTYYCFGCGEKGDVFSFVEKFEGLDFVGSLKVLAEKAGVDISSDWKSEKKDDKDRWYEIMEISTKFFESNIHNNDKVLAYLKSRGLKDETIKSFRIGFAGDKWRDLLDHLLSLGFDLKDIETVGLIKSKNENHKNKDNFYDRFRSRIMFPINDSSGRVIAFSGRIFDLDNNSQFEQAKYLNSPDTPLFNKSNVLFGIDKAKVAIKIRGYSIIVEGQIDLVLSHQAGFTNTVAVSGTAFSQKTEEDNSLSKINNLGLIKRISPNIIFAFDGDDAGLRASNRSAMIALSLDMQVKIASLPIGKDPADIILGNINEWKDIIKNSLDIINFHLDKIINNSADIRQVGKKIREIIFPFLLMIRSSVDRFTYLSLISKKSGISESSLIKDFDDYEKSKDTIYTKQISNSKEVLINNTKRRNNLEEKFFMIVFDYIEKDIEIKEILDLFDSFKSNIQENLFQEMYERNKVKRDSLLFEAEILYGDNLDLVKKDFKEIALNLEEEILNDEKRSLQPFDTKEKLIRFNNIIKRIEEIKQKRFS